MPCARFYAPWEEYGAELNIELKALETAEEMHHGAQILKETLEVSSRMRSRS